MSSPSNYYADNVPSKSSTPPAAADTGSSSPPMPPISTSSDPTNGMHSYTQPLAEPAASGPTSSAPSKPSAIVRERSGPVISMDLLLDPLDQPDDLSGGVSLLANKPTVDSLKRITTSDAVKVMFLGDASDSKLSAADVTSAPSSQEHREQNVQNNEDSYAHSHSHPQENTQTSQQAGCPGCPMLQLANAFGRITTEDLMKECRQNEARKLSSSDWNAGFQEAMRSRSNTGDDFMKDMLKENPDRISSSEWQNYLPPPLDTGLRSRLNTGDISMGNSRSRLNTGDDIMRENIRMTSSEWIGDYQNESMRSIGAAELVFEVPSSLANSNNASNSSMAMSHPPPLPPINSTSGVAIHSPIAENTNDIYSQLSQKTDHELQDMIFSASELQHLPELPTASAVSEEGATTNSIPRSRTKSPASSTKSKKRKKRVIDESRAVEPTDYDVLFGRGGFTNTHPGNIKFREEALKLRPWYESSSKEEKFHISDLLVESVKSEGHRFLEKGSDGLWHEVIGNGARKKASQALRERVKKKSLGSSITSATSARNGEGGDDDQVEV